MFVKKNLHIFEFLMILMLIFAYKLCRRIVTRLSMSFMKQISNYHAYLQSVK